MTKPYELTATDAVKLLEIKIYQYLNGYQVALSELEKKKTR